MRTGEREGGRTEREREREADDQRRPMEGQGGAKEGLCPTVPVFHSK